MRKIDNNVAIAVNNRYDYKSGNTRVEVVNNNVFVYLHNNLIYRIIDGAVSFTLAGWNTQTTRSRLNALGVNIKQKNYDAILNGRKIDPAVWYWLSEWS